MKRLRGAFGKDRAGALMLLLAYTFALPIFVWFLPEVISFTRSIVAYLIFAVVFVLIVFLIGLMSDTFQISRESSGADRRSHLLGTFYLGLILVLTIVAFIIRQAGGWSWFKSWAEKFF